MSEEGYRGGNVSRGRCGGTKTEICTALGLQQVAALLTTSTQPGSTIPAAKLEFGLVARSAGTTWNLNILIHHWSDTKEVCDLSSFCVLQAKQWQSCVLKDAFEGLTAEGAP